MHNLLKFLSRFHLIFLFVFLELLAIIIIIQNNSYHKANFINSANFLTGTIYSRYKDASIYINLKEDNEKLAKENAALRNKVLTVEYKLIPELYEENRLTQDTIIDTLTQDSLEQDTLILDTLTNFTYTAALAISNSINKRYNYIYLDKGTKDGLKTNMGILESNGIVGVIVNTSYNYSVVMPLINEKSKISVKIENQGYFGTLQWTKGDVQHAEIKEIPKHVKLELGDTVVTSGYSQIFSQGLLIGFVEESTQEPGSSFLKVKIRLAVDFSRINYVYTLDNNQLDNLKELYIE